MSRMAKHDAQMLFECSWEVCNKVGGIYTVVVSKAAQINAAYGGEYIAIGPYFHNNTIGQFQEEIAPPQMKKAFDALKEKGIVCHYGTWLIEGMPKAILLDTAGFGYTLNDIKKRLWEWHKVDSLNAPADYNEPVLWSYASGMLIELLAKESPSKKIAAQFHEWLSGAGLLYLKRMSPAIGTIFTTHATVLGRSLANSEFPLYEMLEKIKPDEECYKHHVESKHFIEKASAKNADCFTTVSEITGMEAEHLLGKKPEVLLPNGLDLGKFPIFEEILLKHRTQRDRISEFCLAYFFPYYQFDLKNTLYFFTASRYEFRAKGIDLFIEALGILNTKFKGEKSSQTIVAFLWVPTGIRNIRPELIENKTYFSDIRDFFNESKEDIEKNLLYALVDGKGASQDRILGEEFQREMRKKLAHFKKKGTPPIMTHDVSDSNDVIVRSIKSAGLLNREEDRVKVIYYPIYLDGADGLLDLDYYEAMQGSHLGVFPSYYEPWGYTPLEAGALGVPAITTDLSGFGRYFCRGCSQSEYPGIYIVNRLGKKYEQAREQLAELLHQFALLPREARTKNKLEARRVAGTVDWVMLVENYLDAHNVAMKKAMSR